MDTIYRPAIADDLPVLTDLYNHYVRETPVTFDLEPFSVEARRPWFDGFAPGTPHQLWVAEGEGGVLGFSCSHSFRHKAAYRTSVETTVYCAPDATGRGLGRALYTVLFRGLEGFDLNRAYAGVTWPNPASAALHEAFGFRRIATFSEVGYKQGRFWDVVWFEKPL
ncbi:MAG: N-acetyltransferase [Deltaproteobacteria bacterium]|nr:N-acetyltransferase [Deltaproteobacteria bacterium]